MIPRSSGVWDWEKIQQACMLHCWDQNTDLMLEEHSSGLHSVVSQKIEHMITTAVRTLDCTSKDRVFHCCLHCNPIGQSLFAYTSSLRAIFLPLKPVSPLVCALQHWSFVHIKNALWSILCDDEYRIFYHLPAKSTSAVVQKFINLHRTQLQSYLFILFLTSTTRHVSAHPQAILRYDSYKHNIQRRM
jgi:hypothetical protein